MEARNHLSGPVLPLKVGPMLARTGEGPLGSPDYAYEVKWDGIRVLIGLEDGRLSFHTRNALETAPRYPELHGVRGAVTAARVILDGEIVRMVDGKPSFGALQHRLQLTAPAEIARLSREEPAALILFDVLRLEDEWLTGRTWEERRRRLEEALRPSEAVQLSPVFPRGDTLFETVARMGLEGVMAKRRAGRYYPGQRSGEWLKIKNQQTLDAVVGGWTEGTGTRAETLGALMLGIPAPQGLVYVGNVGSGFSDELLEPSAQLLRGIEVPECPFEGPPPRTDRRPHWVRPALVCEVRHLGWTVDARLRFPVFLRWRPDKRPGECEIPPQVPQDA